MDWTLIIGIVIPVALLALFISEMLPSKEQREYKKAKKFPMECVNCKQAKTYLDVSVGLYSDYEKGIVTGFSERVPTYCYMMKKPINNRKQHCKIPMHNNDSINEAFMRDNIIKNYQPAIEVRTEPVFISLSGRKYHTAECTQIKGKKYVTTVGNACSKGYFPCSKCKPPK